MGAFKPHADETHDLGSTTARWKNVHADRLVVSGVDNAATVLTSEIGGPLSMSNNKIINLAEPTGPSDAATKSYVDAIVGGAPEALNTLNELADALNDDSNFATTVTNSLSTKLDTADFSSSFDTALGAKSTTDLTEGSNLYYTDARVRSVLTSDNIANIADVDAAEADAITSSNSYTDGRETAITTAYQSYADTAETNAVATANAYTDARETEITTAYQSYADTAESDAVTSANTNTDTLIGDTTVDGSAGNTITDRIASAIASKDNTDEITEGSNNLYFLDERVQSTHYYGKATTTISKGDVVMFSGAQGDHLLIARADMDSAGFIPELIMGIAKQDFAVNDFGYVVSTGQVTGLDMGSFSNGDLLWFDPDNPGALTDTKPAPADGHAILVAAVTNAADSENGSIQVRINHKPDTNEIPEGVNNNNPVGANNLYFTNDRADDRADARIAAASIGALSDVDITTTSPTDTQVLKWDNDNSKFVPGDAASSVANLTDVDLTGLANNSVLKYDNTTSKWIIGTNSTAQATANVIVPFAFANVSTTSNGSGTNISWSNWNASNHTLDFTFGTAQANTNYAVITDSETFDNYYVGISNKTTTGFRAEFYDDSQSRTPSGFSPFSFVVYAENPAETIYADSYSSVGDLPDVDLSNVADESILRYDALSSKFKVSTALNTAETNIATNTTNIATNTTNIATNTTNIATNTTDIATNTTDIATNTTNIATNTTNIATNTTNIATNTTNIATNVTDIATNTTNIATNTTNIATNTTNIATNTTDIGTNTTNIATNATNIATNTTDIGTNTTNIATNTTNISTNTTNISTNTTNIATNTTDIAANVTAITSIQNVNTTQGTAIASLQNDLDSTQTGAGLDADGDYTADATTNYLTSATSLKDADKKLDAQVKSNADAISSEATTRANADTALQTEVDAIETAVGLSANGTKTDFSSANYIVAVGTFKAAIEALDGQLKSTQDDLDTAEGEIDTLQTDLDAAEVTIAAHTTLLDTHESSIGLNSDGSYTAIVGNYATDNNLKAAVGSLDSQVKTNADAIALKASQADLNTLQGEVDAIETAVGLNANGTFNGFTTSNYLNASTSTRGALLDLDGQVKTNADTISTETTNRTNADSAIQTELDATQTGAGLAANGAYTTPAGNTYLGGASLKADIALLDTQLASTQSDLDTAEASLATAQGDITDLKTLADTHETAIGLNANGTYSVPSGTNYLGGATSIRNESVKLDTQVKLNADAIVTKAPLNSPTFLGTVQAANLQLSGSLTVNGTTTTVNSTTVTIDDPIFTLGGDTAPSTDDSKDRGIEFRYYDTEARIGFMGWDNSADKFVLLKNATNTNEVFSGTAADLSIGTLTTTGITLDNVSITTIQTEAEISAGGGAAGFDDNDTSLLTAAAIKQYIEAQNFGSGSGDITEVNITAGTGLTGTKQTLSNTHTQTLSVTGHLADIVGLSPNDNDFIVYNASADSGNGAYITANAAAARTALGVDPAGTDNSTDVTLANTNYLSISGQEITGGTIPVSSGGTGATTAAAARTALGVDAAGTDNSTNVTLATVTGNYLSISGQEITAGTVPLSLGGTGATTAAAARTALGVDASGTDNSTDVTLTTVTDNYLSIAGQAITAGTVPVSLGGTGATTAALARAALDVDQAGTDNSTDVTLASVADNYLSISGQAITAGIVPVSLGGTGATTAAAARTALGVDAAGTDNSTNVTLSNTNYLSISGQEITGGTVPVSSGGTGATTAAAARTALGVDAAGTDNSTDVTLATVENNYLSITGQTITAGTVPVSLGGTGATTAAAARTALGVDAAGTDNSTNVTLANTNYLSISGQEITGGTVPVSSGGTGATTAAAARTALGVDAAGTDNSTNVTLATVTGNYLTISGQEITAGTVPLSLGGTGATTAAAARTALGVDAAGTDNSTNVTLANTNYLSISGQEITGGTVPVSSGGTGATTAAAARAALDVDQAGTDNSTNVTLATVTGNYLTISGQEITASIVPVSLGGTGATTAAAARTALGVDVAGTDNSTNVTLANTNYLSISGQEITGGTVPVTSGGTGATTAAAARTALGLGTGNSPQFTSLTLSGQSSSLSMNSQKITSLATPTFSTDAANKGYVDGLVQGISAKTSVIAATTETGDLSTKYENGDVIDGVTLSTGDRILIKDHSTASENGIYVVKASGAPSRADDMAAGSNAAGVFVFVEEGTVNGDNGFLCTTNEASATVGTHSLTFVQFSGAGQITAGTGLSKSGNTLNVNISETNNANMNSYLIFADSYSGDNDLEAHQSLYYNPATDTLHAGSFSGNSATATTATNVTATAHNGTSETVYLTFVDSNITGSEGIETDTDLTYNPSTNKLTTGIFEGSGNHFIAHGNTDIHLLSGTTGLKTGNLSYYNETISDGNEILRVTNEGELRLIASSNDKTPKINLYTQETAGLIDNSVLGEINFYGSESSLDYDISASIQVQVDNPGELTDANAWIPNTSHPSMILFKTTQVNGTSPTPALTLDSNQDALFYGNANFTGNIDVGSIKRGANTAISFDTSGNITNTLNIKGTSTTKMTLYHATAGVGSADSSALAFKKWYADSDAITNGDPLGEIIFQATQTTTNPPPTFYNGPKIIAAADGTWTPGSAHPGRLDFYTSSGTSQNLVLTLDSSGDATLEDGTLHLQGTSTAKLTLYHSSSNSTFSPELVFEKYDSGGLTGGDNLGEIVFKGSEDNSTFYEGPKILAEADGTWTPGSAHPGRLGFYTSSGTTQSLALSLDSNQDATFSGDVTLSDGILYVKGSDTAKINIHHISASTGSGPELELTTYKTSIVAGDNLGEIWFKGSENNSTFYDAAAIIGEADGDWNPGTSNHGRLSFYTTSGTATYNEVLRLSSDKSATFSSDVNLTGKILVKQDAESATNSGIHLVESDDDNDIWAIYRSETYLNFSRSENGGSSYTNHGWINPAAPAGEIDFTGQHRSISSELNGITNNDIGKIVVSTGAYRNLNTENADKPNIDESLPTIMLSNARNDKKVYGVVSSLEDPNESSRQYNVGIFGSAMEKNGLDDNRVIVNAIGEGAIWVCNINGNLENGDYITTCEVPGLGMKQDDDLLHNYTVAKITQDCEFDLNATNYDVVEFVHEGQTYRKAFVGCTYHCG